MPRPKPSGRSGGRRKPQSATRNHSRSRREFSKPGRSEDKAGTNRSKRSNRYDNETTGKKFISRGYGKKTTAPQDKPVSYAKPDQKKSPYNRYEKKPYSKRSEEAPDKKRSFFNKQRFKRDEPVQKAAKKKQEIAVQPGKMRLNKFISNSGVCSRREADNLIAMGLISVNGKVITEMGYKVSPGDEVRYEGKILRAEKPVYILMNKPKGFLTTTNDPQERNTVMHLIGSAVKERVYPVGRLDRNTTGLLLLTNDGDLAEKLTHPSYNVKKIYKVELDKPLTKNDFQKILDGVLLEEGRAGVDDLAIVSPDGKTIGVELHIGWNRVVRRIFEALGYQVIKLDRTVYAGLDKKDLPRGEWRFLTQEEIVHLKHFK